MNRLLPLLLFTAISSQILYSQLPSPIEFGYDYSSSFSSSESDSPLFFFYNDRYDVVHVYSKEFEELVKLEVTCWSHATDPVKSGDNWIGFGSSREGLIIYKYNSDGSLQDTLLLGGKCDYASLNEDELIIVQDYPYLLSETVMMENATIRHIDLATFEESSVSTVEKSYSNLSGGLWTTNVSFSRGVVAIIDPLASMVHLNSKSSNISWSIPTNGEGWSDKMKDLGINVDSIIKTGGIKWVLGSMMSEWQTMDREHIENVFFDESMVVVLKTKDFQSELMYFTQDGQLIKQYHLDKEATRPYLGQRVIVQDGRFNTIRIDELGDSIFYSIVESSTPLSQDTLQVCITDFMICESCIDDQYTGLLLIPNQDAIHNKIERARLQRKYPLATILTVNTNDVTEFSTNRILTLTGIEVKSLFSQIEAE
ncbi:hypothetical protein [Phaeocystidibacter marisrubri]|uniref:Uncharacterized protein n=1 Tax=Phaeocystidibacter marisrubri TaxID=1577780 RepID=A0A6L3ZGE3_9FLAO|nr:hypothetical protein [Phaeocystidibacter marisrubri]KAB2816009.1 hypothetical protein F8C82_09955 [Phaeocystidibacter marisrubri]GGH66860.1 hypothetical protein GCM10011318_05250 [Phaeocystidibacter marisrubri]